MSYEVVSGIPSGILICKMDEKEVAIRKISPEYIEVWLADKTNCEANELDFFYYDFANASYRQLRIPNVTCITVEKGDFFYSYSYAIKNDDFRKMFDFVVKQYYRYIMLKSESYDNQFSKELTGYPAEKDEQFSVDYKSWFDVEPLLKKIKDLKFEVALSLENEIEYEKYLENIWETSLDVQRIYIGNAYCPHLFPSWETLKKIVEVAKRNGHQVTIVTSYLKENKTGYMMKENLQKILNWSLKNHCFLEIEVNDWGYLQELRQNKWVRLNFGRLLNKRRKDPRHEYKAGFAKQMDLLAENQLNQPLFTYFLEEKGITRYEYETCGYEMKIAKGNHSLHLPFYQTNTSQFCTLRALCEYGDRGAQMSAEGCPKYCETYACAYPEHLHMIGKYNSIFALDTELFGHLEWLDKYKEQGIDRIVWNMK